MITLKSLGEVIPVGERYMNAHVHKSRDSLPIQPGCSNTRTKWHQNKQEAHLSPDRSHVAWSQGLCLKQLIHFDPPCSVVKMCWATFKDHSEGNTLCLLTSDGLLHGYSDQGDCFRCRLPFPVVGLWPLGPGRGVLVQRLVDEDMALPLESLFYSLGHFQEEWRPFQLSSSARGQCLQGKAVKLLSILFDQELGKDRALMVLLNGQNSALQIHFCSYKADNALATLEQFEHHGAKQHANKKYSLSEWSLELFWEEQWTETLPSGTYHQGEQCWLYHDILGRPHVVVHDRIKKAAHVYAMEMVSGRPKVVQSSVLDAAAITSMYASRPNKLDLLILRRNGNLELDLGDGQFLPVSLPETIPRAASLSSLTVSRPHGQKRERDLSHRPEVLHGHRQARVVGFKEAVDGYAILIMSSGTLLRLSVDLKVHCKLVQKCFHALEKVVDMPLLTALRRGFILESFGNPQNESEWNAFAVTLMSLLQAEDDAAVNNHTREFLLTLHQVYEEMKLNVLALPQRRRLVQLLVNLASKLRLGQFLMYYRQDFPDLDISALDLNGSDETMPLDLLNLIQRGKYSAENDTLSAKATALLTIITSGNQQCDLAPKESLKLPRSIRSRLRNHRFSNDARSTTCNKPILIPLTEIFPDDLRAEEALKLLDSTRVAKVELGLVPVGDIPVRQQAALQMSLTRTFSRPLGRAIIQLKTKGPKDDHKHEIPKLECTGRIVSLMTTVTPDPVQVTAETMAWPEFHNGVAEGLSVASNDPLDASWIIFNRPEEPDNEHAGFLLGLGLSGHLRRMLRYELFEYLNAKHDMTSIGLLLGLASTYFGTMNEMTTKLISLHIPALLPPQSSDLNLSSIIQSTALLSLGMVYCGTLHRRMAEVALGEIGRNELIVSDAHNVYREGYSLSAGFALGLITLGQGSNAKGLDDMHILERLCSYMEGGNTRGPKYASHLDANDIQSHRFDQGDAINKDVTSPGAHVALTLMYLKTHDTSAMNRIPVPDTLAMLEQFRADILLLRVLARSLIMWNDMEVSKDWVDQHVPDYVKDSSEDVNNKQLLIQTHRSIVSGACFALALRYAGSQRDDLIKIILGYLDEFISSCSSSAVTSTLEKKMTRSTTMMCINTLCLAASVVAAGSGSIDVFKRLRILRNRMSSEVSYGDHMACHMAIGILFMGGGRFSFSTDNQSVAMLLCSLYPRFPVSVSDQRTHNQIFRHLWVLAAQYRCLSTVDASTKSIVSVPVSLQLDDTKSITKQTPCLLPSDERLVAVELGDDKFYHRTILPKDMIRFRVALDPVEKPSEVDWRDKARTLLERSAAETPQLHGMNYSALSTTLEYNSRPQTPLGLLPMLVGSTVNPSAERVLEFYLRYCRMPNPMELGAICAEHTDIALCRERALQDALSYIKHMHLPDAVLLKQVLHLAESMPHDQLELMLAQLLPNVPLAGIQWLLSVRDKMWHFEVSKVAV